MTEAEGRTDQLVAEAFPANSIRGDEPAQVRAFDMSFQAIDGNRRFDGPIQDDRPDPVGGFVVTQNELRELRGDLRFEVRT